MSASRTSASCNTLCVPADNPKVFKTVCAQSPKGSCGQKCTGFTELSDCVELDRKEEKDQLVTMKILNIDQVENSFVSERKSCSITRWKPCR